jgi:hypothetical protein
MPDLYSSPRLPSPPHSSDCDSWSTAAGEALGQHGGGADSTAVEGSMAAAASSSQVVAHPMPQIFGLSSLLADGGGERRGVVAVPARVAAQGAGAPTLRQLAPVRVPTWPGRGPRAVVVGGGGRRAHAHGS